MEFSRTVDSANNNKRCRLTRLPWKPEEDELLVNLVKQHGPHKWSQIAKHIPQRTGSSCRVRWINQLKPGVNKLPFSGEENRKLLQLHKKYGNMWSTISDFFPGRTDNQMKNQFNFLVRNKCHESLNPPPNTYSRGTLNRGVTNLSKKSTVSVSSQVSGFSGLGNKFTLCPHLTYRTEMPSFGGGSSLSARDEALLAAHFSNSFCDSHQSTFVMCEGVAKLELFPLTQRQQGLVVKERKFIDFMGVGNSE